ncbi:MAG: hypothetical protein U0271_16415 [Polyangiaceae bacterium]
MIAALVLARRLVLPLFFGLGSPLEGARSAQEPVIVLAPIVIRAPRPRPSNALPRVVLHGRRPERLGHARSPAADMDLELLIAAEDAPTLEETLGMHSLELTAPTLRFVCGPRDVGHPEWLTREATARLVVGQIGTRGARLDALRGPGSSSACVSGRLAAGTRAATRGSDAST